MKLLDNDDSLFGGREDSALRPGRVSDEETEELIEELTTDPEATVEIEESSDPLEDHRSHRESQILEDLTDTE